MEHNLNSIDDTFTKSDKTPTRASAILQEATTELRKPLLDFGSKLYWVQIGLNWVHFEFSCTRLSHRWIQLGLHWFSITSNLGSVELGCAQIEFKMNSIEHAWVQCLTKSDEKFTKEITILQKVATELRKSLQDWSSKLHWIQIVLGGVHWNSVDIQLNLSELKLCFIELNWTQVQ